MGEYKNLKDSISSYKKTTKNLNTYNDYNITKETLEQIVVMNMTDILKRTHYHSKI